MSEPLDEEKDYESQSTETLCEISKYLPGIACETASNKIWGHGALVKVCDFHAQLPCRGTETELLTVLYELEKSRGQNQDGRV